MSRNNLPPLPKPAKRGAKKGWKLVGGEVPPDVAETFHRIAIAEGTSRSELAGRLITDYVVQKVAA